jgi:nitronate monooxygenase
MSLPRIKTPFTDLFGCPSPLIAGPMFLVSDEGLVSAVSQAGALGGMPSLNWRTSEEFRAAVREVKRRTSQPFAVNLIVNQVNPRQKPDLEICWMQPGPAIFLDV